MRPFTILPAIALIVACAQSMPQHPTALPFFGNGYRFEGDICRRVGEDAYTNQFLDDAADLVACPTVAENVEIFLSETGAREIAQRDGYTLYSISTR